MSKKSKTSKPAAAPTPAATAVSDKARAEAIAQVAKAPDAAAKGKKATKQPKAAKAKAAKPKKTSALDAAAQILAGAAAPMGAKELIAEMSKRKLWSSPDGKTPAATLYAAMIREIAAKGKDSRFTKVDRGMFTGRKGN
jgi:hypothetical protein